MRQRRRYDDKFRASAVVMLEAAGKAYIYGLRAKDSYKYFYVGSTKFEVEYRLGQHLYEVKNDTHLNAHFLNKAKKIGVENIVADTLDEIGEDFRFVKESEWIDRLLKDGHPLVNWCYNPDKFTGAITEAVDPYTPQKLLLGYLTVLDNQPSKAQGPKDQWLLDSLHKIIEDTIRHMLKKYPDETWKDLLFAAQQEVRKCPNGTLVN